MVNFLNNLVSSILGTSSEEGKLKTKKENAEAPNSSTTTLRDESSHPVSSHPPTSNQAIHTQRDASRQNQGAERKAATTRSTSEERRLLGDYSEPADATLIQLPGSSPYHTMPKKSFGNAPGLLAGRNTLNEPKRKTANNYSSGARAPLATAASRGDTLKHPSRQLDFPDRPETKRRKTNNSQSTNMDINGLEVINLDVPGEPPLQKKVYKGTIHSSQIGPHIPPPVLSGVAEFRNVGRLVAPSRVVQKVDSQRGQDRTLRGHTREQAVVLDDDSQLSTGHASKEKEDPTMLLSDYLSDELGEVSSQKFKSKKREASHTAGTTSHHIKDLKRPKTMSEFAGTSDEEIGEGLHPAMNATGLAGRVSKEQPLSKTFVRDNRISQSRSKAFNDANDGDDMTDELGLSPETTRVQRPVPKKPPNSPKRRRAEEKVYEIKETPPPEDMVISSADIKPTSFQQTPQKESGKNKKGAVRQDSKGRQEGVYPLSSYQDSLNRIGKDLTGLLLKLNDQRNGFALCFSNQPTAIATIEIAKMVGLQWSPDESRLVRIQGVRDAANKCNLTWDLEFEHIEDVKTFGLRLKILTTVKYHPRKPDEMRKMFEIFPTQRLRTEPEDDVVDRGIEERLLDQRVHNFNKAERDARGTSTQSRPAKQGTILSNLKASVPQETRRTTRGQPIDPIKFDHVEESPYFSTERPKRSTRTTKQVIRTPTPEPERYSKTHDLGPTWDQPVVYPERDPTDRSRKQVSIEFEDLERLDDGEWLNDSLVEFCLLHHQQRSKAQASKVFFFNNFFYTKLTMSAKGRSINYDAVQRWTAKDDIFTYDFVVVPVCEKGHWYLALICNLPNLQRKLALDDDVKEEVKSEPIEEHNGQTETTPTAVVAEGIISPKQEDGRLTEHSILSLDGPAVTTNDTAVEVEDAVDLVKNKAEDYDTEPVLKHNDSVPPADPIYNSHAKTIVPGPKRKGKRHSIRTYPPDTPTIAILDSMPNSVKHYPTINALKDYLIEEARSKRSMEISKEDLQGMHATAGLPQQDNFSDCGVFLGRYVRELLTDPKDFGEKLLGGELEKLNWGNWNASSERAVIRNTLQELAHEQAEKRRQAKAERRAAKAKRAATQPKVAEDDQSDSKTPTQGENASVKAPSIQDGNGSPIKASDPPDATNLADAKSRFQIPPSSSKITSSPVRATSPIRLRSPIIESPARRGRGHSIGPQWSAHSTPGEYDLYPDEKGPIIVYDETTADVASESEHQGLMREQIDDDMLFDKLTPRLEEDFQPGQLLLGLEAAAADDGNMETHEPEEEEEEWAGIAETPEGSPAPETEPPTTANTASRRSPKVPVYLENTLKFPRRSHG